MFFYLIHLPLIHIGAQIWAWDRYGQPAGWGYSEQSRPPITCPIWFWSMACGRLM
jgi:hypothetical protein